VESSSFLFDFYFLFYFILFYFIFYIILFYFSAIPLRKFLAANPKVLKDLINEDKDLLVFTRCVGFFFGIRFIQDLEMTQKEAYLFNAMVNLLGTREIHFATEKLSPTTGGILLTFPFDRAPRPIADVINYWKNKRITVWPFFPISSENPPFAKTLSFSSGFDKRKEDCRDGQEHPAADVSKAYWGG